MFGLISTALAAEAGGHGEEAFYQSPEFWLGVAFLIFIVAISRPIARAVTGALDARAAEIARNIDEAQRLYDETKVALESYKQKLAAAGREAAEIIANAEAEAKRLRANAEKELATTLKRREELAME